MAFARSSLLLTATTAGLVLGYFAVYGAALTFLMHPWYVYVHALLEIVSHLLDHLFLDHGIVGRCSYLGFNYGQLQWVLIGDVISRKSARALAQLWFSSTPRRLLLPSVLYASYACRRLIQKPGGGSMAILFLLGPVAYQLSDLSGLPAASFAGALLSGVSVPDQLTHSNPHIAGKPTRARSADGLARHRFCTTAVAIAAFVLCFLHLLLFPPAATTQRPARAASTVSSSLLTPYLYLAMFLWMCGPTPGPSDIDAATLAIHASINAFFGHGQLRATCVAPALLTWTGLTMTQLVDYGLPNHLSRWRCSGWKVRGAELGFLSYLLLLDAMSGQNFITTTAMNDIALGAVASTNSREGASAARPVCRAYSAWTYVSRCWMPNAGYVLAVALLLNISSPWSIVFSTHYPFYVAAMVLLWSFLEVEDFAEFEQPWETAEAKAQKETEKKAEAEEVEVKKGGEAEVPPKKGGEAEVPLEG